MFSDEEIEAFVLGLRLAAEHGDDALGRAAADVLAKLRAVLPKELRALVDETTLLAGPAQQRPADAIDLGDVRRTIRAQRKARIDYVDQQGVASTRIIWPVALAFFERARVVVAWCEEREDFRSFRADRIARWAMLAERLPRSRAMLLREWSAREGIPAQLPG
jgi:predicted DNA-binding transcriptional regulator YafY